VADRPYVVGYAVPWSVRQGEPLQLMLSADAPVNAQVALRRIGAGTERIELGTVEVSPQRTVSGSCVLVPLARTALPAGAFVGAVLCMPTRPRRRQTLLAQRGDAARWWLGLDGEGRPAAECGPATAEGGARTRLDIPLVAGAWYLVACQFDPEAGMALACEPLAYTSAWWTEPTRAVHGGRSAAAGPLPVAGPLDATLGIAAEPGAGGDWRDCFDGKLEAPAIVSGRLDDGLVGALLAGSVPAGRVLAAWDLAGAASGRVRASGTAVTALDGELRNTPLPAVTGHSWNGSATDPRLAPEQYRALHFHADDLDDCGWEPAVELELPAAARSGVYVAEVAAPGRRPAEIPFFVRPGGAPDAPLLFLAPTASYLAYANDHPVSDGDFSEATAGRTPLLYEDDLLLHEHREWGLSMYDAHLDGSGVAISSSRRPMVNLYPSHRYHVGPWQLPSDVFLLEWLDEHGLAYDVATDEDLHREGEALLAPYRAVVTGTHPEYDSTAMLDAIEAYVRGGGRLAYLGANGFYWRVAFDPKRPYVMELRRGQSGSRAWESAPGENHLAYSGETGGLWRHLGRAPQKLTGVGYAGQGFDASGWYRRLPASGDPRSAWIFDGVETETFGTTGRIGGGAVGQELDRCDSDLGSPADALVLATSEGLSEAYQRCVEEVPFTLPGLSALVDPAVRADVVYHVKPGGGAVFATGSIAWCGALGVDPAVSRITANVLRRFCDPAPLPW
jgi:N,N-dimethylformamidase